MLSRSYPTQVVITLISHAESSSGKRDGWQDEETLAIPSSGPATYTARFSIALVVSARAFPHYENINK